MPSKVGQLLKTASEAQLVQLSSTRTRLSALVQPRLALMLPERLNEQIGQNAGILRAYIDTSMNSAILLPELEQKFKGVVTDLEKVRIPALFGAGPLGGRTMLRFFCVHAAFCQAPCAAVRQPTLSDAFRARWL
jgi:hypothetical protein